jgi:biopolymer transport protein ExbD
MNPYVQKFQQGAHGVRNSRRARVEIIPLIDVMFLLVAFFMVISISMVLQKGIFVDLSPAETADSKMDEPDSLVLSVDASGEFYLEKGKVSVEALADFFAKKAKEDRDVSIIINADRQARHEDVIKALDLVRSSGLHNVIFSVEPKE